MVGVEPTRPFGHLRLKQARLPIPPHRYNAPNHHQGAVLMGSSSGMDVFNSDQLSFDLVPMEGLEPSRPFGQQILNLPCLPIPPHRLKYGMGGGSRTLMTITVARF